MSGDGFDRIKPPERRLRERPAGPGQPGADEAGRAALFPVPEPEPEPTGPSVHCSRCDATTGLDARTAVRAALPLFLLAPWKDHPVFAICPACRHRAWLRPSAS